ncbi:MAG: AAA family ATPase [Myxococcales bacterium]|nr:AAA family ATPase [Myxococcales bacterium]
METVPMGYLFCGPVGTGKSFLAQCLAGSIGIPAVVLKNFRSKYVGETEGNLERVLGVLRSMGPVVVIVDEADAMLGDRDQGGDSRVGSRIFGMIAQQMGDTRYRGRILWMLLTARPDLLPIDLKRQAAPRSTSRCSTRPRMRSCAPCSWCSRRRSAPRWPRLTSRTSCRTRATSRGPTSRASSAAPIAPRCSPARPRSPGTRSPARSPASCPRRRPSSARRRSWRRSSSAPTWSFCRRRSESASPPSAAARKCKSGSPPSSRSSRNADLCAAPPRAAPSRNPGTQGERRHGPRQLDQRRPHPRSRGSPVAARALRQRDRRRRRRLRRARHPRAEPGRRDARGRVQLVRRAARAGHQAARRAHGVQCDASAARHGGGAARALDVAIEVTRGPRPRPRLPARGVESRRARNRVAVAHPRAHLGRPQPVHW